MHTRIPRSDMTGLLLAGGLSTRMGGSDKGLMLLQNQTLAARSLERLAPQVGPIIINANRNGATYAKLGKAHGANVIADIACSRWPAQSGPLAGIYTGLSHCRTPWLLTCPCDSPCLPTDMALRMGARLCESGADLAMAIQHDEHQKPRHQPVFCLMRSSLKESLGLYLESGRRKVLDWALAQNHVLVAFDEDQNRMAFANFNTAQDLISAQAVFSRA